MNIKVYTTPTCGHCQQAKRFLSDRGVKYTEYDVSRDQAAAQEMMGLTGQIGVPVIVVDGQPVIGFDRSRLESLLTKGSANGNRPRIGLKVADASKIAQTSGSVPVFGALVGAVAPASPGEKAGLRQGDIITEVDLRAVNGAGDLEKALAGLKAGSRARIRFLRGQESMQAEIITCGDESSCSCH